MNATINPARIINRTRSRKTSRNAPPRSSSWYPFAPCEASSSPGASPTNAPGAPPVVASWASPAGAPIPPLFLYARPKDPTGAHTTAVHPAGARAAGAHTTAGTRRTPAKVLRELTFEAAKPVTGRKTSARVNSRGTSAAVPSQRRHRSDASAATPPQRTFSAAPRRDGSKTGAVPHPRLLPGVLVFATPGPRRWWQSPFGTRQSCPCASARACRCPDCPCRRR